MRKFFIALLLFLVAAELELMLGAMGVFISVTLGVLVACACELSLQAFIVLDLVAAIIFRTGSLADQSFLILLIFPLVIGFFYRSIQWEPWVLVPVAAALGAILMVSMSGVSMSTIGIVAILEDVIITGAVGFAAYAMVSNLTN